MPRSALESGDRGLQARTRPRGRGRCWRRAQRQHRGRKVERFLYRSRRQLKALRYFFCVVLPPVAVLMTGRLGSFLLSLVLTLLGWIPGVIHACLVVNDYHEEQRIAALPRRI